MVTNRSRSASILLCALIYSTNIKGCSFRIENTNRINTSNDTKEIGNFNEESILKNQFEIKGERTESEISETVEIEKEDKRFNQSETDTIRVDNNTNIVRLKSDGSITLNNKKIIDFVINEDCSDFNKFKENTKIYSIKENEFYKDYTLKVDNDIVNNPYIVALFMSSNGKKNCYYIVSLSGNSDLSDLFLKNKNISKIIILGTNKITNMSGMFSGCEKLKELKFITVDTSNVTDMSFMFYF